uniref:Putative ionotropic receptor ligand binding domain-containing protein n=1 Tax=Stomoxys calcitrans TaxID=35570 RepID=A0A1I8PUX0_STOCA
MNTLMEITLNDNQTMANLPLILATVWIMNNDFALQSVSAVTIGQYANSIAAQHQQNGIIDEVLRRTMMAKNQLKYFVEGEMFPFEFSEEFMSSEELVQRFFKYYANRETCVWFLDSLESYNKLEEGLLDESRHYQRHGYFLLVYTGLQVERMNHVREIFHRLFYIYVINVNILMMIGKHAYLYTYFPFSPNQCHASQPELYVSFSDIEGENFTINKTLYPNKVRNMHRCPLTIVTWNLPPFIFVEKDKETGDLISLFGIEGSMITLLAELMNFTIKVVEPKPRERGNIYPNGTSTGATRMILEAEANITLYSYIYNSARSQFLAASNSYTTSTFYMAISNGDPLAPFARLTKPFSYIIWTCLGSSTVLAIISIYYIRFLGKSKLMDFIYGRGNRLPFSNLLSTLLGGPVFTKVPFRNFARFILLAWMWYTFILRAAYSGELYTILQDGYSRNTVKTLADIVEHNYVIQATPTLEKFIKGVLPTANTRTLNEEEDTINTLLEQIGDPEGQEKIALCALDYTIKYYNQLHPTRRVDLLEQTIITSPLVFYTSRYAYFNKRMNSLILEISAVGMMKRLRKIAVYAPLKAPRRHGKPLTLTFEILLGVFYIYAVCVMFCLLVFLLEIWSKKSFCIKIVIDFFNM